MDCWAAKSTHATLEIAQLFLAWPRDVLYIYTQYTLYNYIIYILYIYTYITWITLNGLHLDHLRSKIVHCTAECGTEYIRGGTPSEALAGVVSLSHIDHKYHILKYLKHVLLLLIWRCFNFGKRRTTHFTTGLSFRFNDSRKVICCLQKGMIRDGMPSPTQTGWKCAVPDSLSATPSKVRDLQNIIMGNQEVLRQKLFLLNRDPNADYTFAGKNMQEKHSALNRRSTSLISN